MNPKAYLSYTTNNIGDDMQSYALTQILGDPDLYVDRDKLDSYTDYPEMDLYANGYMICGPFPPAPQISFIPLALGIGGFGEMTKEKKDYLSSLPVIGCRDHHSVRWCVQRGFNGVYIGCPTMLIKRRQLITLSKRVLCVDVNPMPIREHLKGHQVTWRTNQIQPSAPPEIRKRYLFDLIECITRSNLVITNRIHVAMPAVAMGIPTIIIDDEIIAPWRFSALPEFMSEQVTNIELLKEHGLKRYTIKPEPWFLTEYQNQMIERLNKNFNLQIPSR